MNVVVPSGVYVRAFLCAFIWLCAFRSVLVCLHECGYVDRWLRAFRSVLMCLHESMWLCLQECVYVPSYVLLYGYVPSGVGYVDGYMPSELHVLMCLH